MILLVERGRGERSMKKDTLQPPTKHDFEQYLGLEGRLMLQHEDDVSIHSKTSESWTLTSWNDQEARSTILHGNIKSTGLESESGSSLDMGRLITLITGTIRRETNLNSW